MINRRNILIAAVLLPAVMAFGFVKIGSVEKMKPVGIAGKVRRHPVEDHANIIFMKFIDEKHEVLRRPETGCCRKKTGHLIAPAWVVGIFHHGHEFYMRELHFL